MQAALTFIIPVRHPANARDWGLVKLYLSATIASIVAQEDQAWNAIIVANKGADLPELLPGFTVKWVEFPPNPLFEQGTANRDQFHDAVRLDKGRRILAGMLAAGAMGHAMVVDDDDFVHRELTSFVRENSHKNGWYFDKGFTWKDGGKLLYLTPNYSQLCGTSHIIRSDLYRLPATIEAASEDYIKRMLGSHVMIEGILRESGSALEPLPFPGAVYRVAHQGSHSRSKGIFGQFFDPTKPLRSIKNAARLRFLSKSVQRDFFGK